MVRETVASARGRSSRCWALEVLLPQRSSSKEEATGVVVASDRTDAAGIIYLRNSFWQLLLESVASKT